MDSQFEAIAHNFYGDNPWLAGPVRESSSAGEAVDKLLLEVAAGRLPELVNVGGDPLGGLGELAQEFVAIVNGSPELTRRERVLSWLGGDVSLALAERQLARFDELKLRYEESHFALVLAGGRISAAEVRVGELWEELSSRMLHEPQLGEDEHVKLLMMNLTLYRSFLRNHCAVNSAMGERLDSFNRMLGVARRRLELRLSLARARREASGVFG